MNNKAKAIVTLLGATLLLLAMLLGGERSVSSQAAPSRYVLPGDGTVTDTATGLTWQRWGTIARIKWADAVSLCGTLKSLPGTGWRLPTMKELHTLVDYSRPAPPYIDRVTFPDVPTDANSGLTTFWASTRVVGMPVPGSDRAWNVYFADGATYFNDIATVGAPFRCVRTGGPVATGDGGAGAGGTDGCDGCAVLWAPLKASQSSTFHIDFGGGADLSAPGTTVTYRMCTAATSSPATTFYTFAKSPGANQNHYQLMGSLNQVARCPAMQNVVFTVAGGSVAVNDVRSIGLYVVSGSDVGSGLVASEVHVDSVAVTGNVIGPYDFTFNGRPFYPFTNESVQNTLVSHLPGADGTGGQGGGVAVLSAALPAANSSATFQIDFGGNLNLSAPGTTVNFRLCVAAATGNTTLLHAFALNEFFTSNTRLISTLNVLPSCPTMQEVPFEVRGGTLDSTAVRSIGLKIASDASAGPWTNPTVLRLDAVTVTNNVVGPYDFTFNRHPVYVPTSSPAGSSVSWSP